MLKMAQEFKCCVPGCDNKHWRRKEKGLQFYRFPTRPWLQERRAIWIKFVKRTNTDGSPWTPTPNSIVCSEHFVGGYKSEDPRHPGYNPTIYDPKLGSKEDTKVLMARYHRVVARWNRQKEKESGTLLVTPNTATMKASQSKKFQKKKSIAVSKVSSGNDQVEYQSSTGTCPGSPMEADVEMETTGDGDMSAPIAVSAPESHVGPGSPMEHEVKIDFIDEREKPKIIQGPKQLLCLICCDYCPSESYKSYCNVNFMRLCKLLYPSVPEGNVFLDSLKSLVYLSICPNCQSLTESAAVKNMAVFRVSSKVRELQVTLLKQLKILQQCLGEFQQEMGKIQKSTRDSKEPVLQHYLAAKDANCTGRLKKTRNAAIRDFRRRLIQKVDNLEIFGQEIQKKVNCRASSSNNSKVSVAVTKTVLNQNKNSSSGSKERESKIVNPPKAIDIDEDAKCTQRINTTIRDFRCRQDKKVDHLEVLGQESQKKVASCGGNNKSSNSVESSSSRMETGLNFISSPEAIDPISPESQSMHSGNDGDEFNSFDDPIDPPSETPQPDPTPATQCKISKNLKRLPNSKLLKSPIVLGKTVDKRANQIVTKYHVWDGVQMKTINNPRILLPTTCRPKMVPPKITISCPACKKQIRQNYLHVHRMYSCPVTKAAKPPAQYMCHLCSKTFRVRSWLESHFNHVHNEERPFLCTQCPAAHKTLRGLHLHEKSHSKERPFACRKGCGGGFKRHSYRVRHEELCNGKGTPFRKKAKPPTTTEEQHCRMSDAVTVTNI